MRGSSDLRQRVVDVVRSGGARPRQQGGMGMPKGQRVDGLVSGHRRPRTLLIAARMDGRLAEPCLFEGTCDLMLWRNTNLRGCDPYQ